MRTWKMFLISAILAIGLSAEAIAQTCFQVPLTAPAPLQLKLNWNDNATDETGTIVERKLNNGAYAVLISLSGGSVVEYIDLTVQRAFVPNTYTYRVAAFNANGSSAFSNEACGTLAALPPPKPNAPSGLTLSAKSPTSVQASFRDNSANETKFQVVVDQSSPSRRYVFDGPADSSSIMLTGLTKNKNYCARAYSMINDFRSDASNDSCVTTPK